ncbi:MAG TPA: hypothetical protein VN706_15390 [Gemmatimonadaceae bacterium]|nr:hypothetical protein [Gemmatimonadaceae bacterium]
MRILDSRHRFDRIHSFAAALLTLSIGHQTTLGAQTSGPTTPITGTVVASNMNDNTATLVDAASGRPIATVPTGEGPHEVAISHDGRTAWRFFPATPLPR